MTVLILLLGFSFAGGAFSPACGYDSPSAVSRAQQTPEQPDSPGSPSPAAAETAAPARPETKPAEPAKRLSKAEEIFEKMHATNQGLEDYVGELTVNTKIKYSFLEMPVNLTGTYYYKAPDKHKVEINKAPQFLSKYPQIFGWSLPNPDEFTVKVFDSYGSDGNSYLLRMVPKRGRGDLLKVEIVVDKSTYLFSRQIYYYRDEGEINIANTYKTVEGFNLFDTVNGVIKFPKVNVNATLDAVYNSYKINQGLSDDIFEKK